MERLGVTDINDPRIMEFINPKANSRHYQAWDRILKNKDKVTPDDIIDTWRKVEQDRNTYIDSETPSEYLSINIPGAIRP